MSSVTDNLLKENVQQEGSNDSFLTPILIALCVVMAAMFIGEMLFGKNSLEVYLALQKDQATLEKKIHHLKNKNAALQKEYFELKSIMPSKEDE